jgi:prepilin-type N-terminal cleavage/methylation domain-containing protein
MKRQSNRNQINDKPDKEAGFTLVEALVSLAILSIAVVGATGTVSNGHARLASIEREEAALAQLRYRFDEGVEGEGQVRLGPSGINASWSVTRSEAHRGQLAGVETSWVNIRAEIVWPNAGRERQLVLERTEMVARTGIR